MSRSDASTRYNKANTTTILLRLNRKTDKEIIEHLDKQENKNGYIKGLILSDAILRKIFEKGVDNEETSVYTDNVNENRQ